MAALVLACKQIWGHVHTCATAVKMADLKYYSFKFKFSQSFVFLFLFALCRTRHQCKVHRFSRCVESFSRRALTLQDFPLVVAVLEQKSCSKNMNFDPIVLKTGNDAESKPRSRPGSIEGLFG